MKTRNGVQLSDEQIAAAERIHAFDGRCIVLTGNAGTGKSSVIDALVTRYGSRYRLSATTGRAAMVIGGCTVDSLFCFRRDNWSVREESADYILTNAPRRIVIDEASMIGRSMADVICRLAARYDKTIIAVGDWAQCSPVKDNWPFGSKLFESSEVISLRENHRQSDAQFMSCLNDLRDGDISTETDAIFRSRELHSDVVGDDAVRMFATNADTDSYNEQRLYATAYQTKHRPVEMMSKIFDRRPRRSGLPEWLQRRILEDSGLAHDLPVLPSARVMLVRNSENLESYVNGDVGVVEDIQFEIDGVTKSWAEVPEEQRRNPTGLTVRLDRLNQSIEVRPIHTALRGGDGLVEFEVVGLPVKLGWACTIHKSQGMTLARAFVDVGSVLRFPPDGRHGIAYVGLSRTRTLDDLTVYGWTRDAIYCDPSVREMVR